MKANRGQIEKALDTPSDAVRLYLLYGPDEAGSAALSRRLERAMGEGAERIDLEPSALRTDPARLADEAASLSMFGDRRWIRVVNAGEDCVAAAEALLGAAQAGNPVLFLAGAIRNTTRLAKLCLDHAGAMAFASYVPDEREAAQIAVAIAREQGLRLSNELARRIAENSGGDRALMQGEIDKVALFLDASPGSVVEATAEAVEALSAETGESDTSPLVNAVLGGDLPAVKAELGRLAANNVALAAVTRPLLGRAVLLAQIRAEFERSGRLEDAMGSAGKAVFWKEKGNVQRQVRMWSASDIARLLHRLLDAERATRDSTGPGDIAVNHELLTIARQAARLR